MSFSSKFARVLAGCAAALLSTLTASAGPRIAHDFGFPIITSYWNDAIGDDAQTYCSAQRRDGVLYFGGKTLLSFDGDRWTNTAVPEVSWIQGLDFGPHGRLWTAAEAELGWFQQRPDSRWVFHSLNRYLSPGDVPRGPVLQAFSDGPDGAVFISADRVYRWNGSSFHVWAMPGVRRLNAFRINGSIYVDYRKQGLFRLTAAGPRLLIPQALIGNENTGAVIWIDAQPDHWLLATGDGLLMYRHGRTAPFAPAVSTLLRTAAVTCGTRLPTGGYAFGTFRGGIVFMDADGTLDHVLTEKDGLPATSITSLYVDQEGSLWATSPSHIIRVDLDPSSRIFDGRAHLAPQMYRAITRADGHLTVLNGAGVLTLDADRRHFTAIPPLTGSMHDITASPQGLIVSGYRGAWRMTGGKMTTLVSSVGDIQMTLPSRIHPGAYLASEDPNPRVVEISPDGSERVIVDRLRAAATSLAEDNRGRLWMGTDSQGAFIAPRDPASPAHPESVSQRFHLPKLEGAAKVRATPEGGVLLFGDKSAWYEPAGSDTLTPVVHFPSRSVIAVSNVTPDGRAWVVHPASRSYAACVAEIIIRHHQARWVPNSVLGFDTIGAPLSIYSETNRAGQPVLWIGGTKGVLRHVVERGPMAPRPRPPLLWAFAREKANAPRQPITGALPFSTRAIEFEFAEPEFARRASIRLQTHIDGVDSGWVPAGADSLRELTAIRDGRYVFRVRAVAESGVASEPTVFSFEVAPPWWRTTPALLLGLAALIPLAYTVYRLRVRTLRRRNAVLEEKVRQRTEELAEASAAKTLFVANMSHDIRNPLNGIVGLTLALEDTRLDGQQREIIATLRECTTYLSSLVDDVLDFASIEAGRVEIRPGPFVPAELLNSVVTTLKSESAKRGALITIETDVEIPAVLQGDAGRIQQILVNYVSNALKYAGGHIRVAASVSTAAPGEIEFSVTDEGPGIPESEQTTLFTKFTRLAAARREHIPGTGLGLASCRLLADIMGGSVGVESQPGQGARFFLRLPLVAAAAEPAPMPADIALPRTSVLLVEDTDYNALAATAVLGKLGLTCDRARNGEEALRMFAANRYNVVLLDRNLPDIDGLEVARRMRELETDGLRALLLAVTAYCTEADRTACLTAGMDAFVGKPLTPEKLRKVLLSAARMLLSTASVDAPAASVGSDLDVTLLKYLADDSENGLSVQVDRFVSTLHEAVEAVATAQQHGTPPALGDAAHHLLGHARMVGATRLIEVAVQFETAARAGDGASVTRLMPVLRNEAAAVTAALRRRFGVRTA